MHSALKSVVLAAVSATTLGTTIHHANASTGDPATSSYYGSCPDFPATATAASPVSASPGPAEENWPIPTPTNVGTTGLGPAVSGIHVDAPALSMASYQVVTDDRNTATQACSINGQLTNTLTIGSGTSGLPTGTPVTVVLTTRLDGTLGFHADPSGSFTADNNATVKFTVADPNNYGLALASYVADGYVETDAATGDLTTGVGGYVEEMYKTDLYIHSNSAPWVSQTPPETYARPVTAWPNSLGVSGQPVDFGNSIGTRTTTFATVVGATLDVTGGIATTESVSNGIVESTADFTDGFTAAFAPDASNPGLAISLVTDAPTLQPTAVFSSGTAPSYQYGEPVRLQVRVGADSGIPSGTITVTDSGTTLDSQTLDTNGYANLVLSALPIGSHSVTLSYAGAPGYAPATGTVVVDVVKDFTTTVIYVDPAHPKPDQRVRLAADVTTALPGVAAPTGSVTFYDGSVAMGSAPVSSGEAVLWVAGKQLTGKHTITAVYNGDATHLTSTAKFTTPKN